MVSGSRSGCYTQWRPSETKERYGKCPVDSGDMIRRCSRMLWLLSFVLSGACGQARHCGQSAPRCLVLNAIERQSHKYDLPFDSALVSSEVDTSAVVAGLRYFEADYYPPGTGDIRLSAQGAARGDRSALVETVSDWIQVVGDWSPRSEADAVGVCGEVAVLTSPAQLYGRPFVYQDSMTVSQLRQDLVMVDDTAALEFLASPQAERREPGWLVSLWVVQARKSVRYECRVSGGDARQLAIELRQTAEDERVGMLWSP